MTRRRDRVANQHVYQSDGTKDLHGNGRCTQCGTPTENRLHKPWPERSDDERAAEARRVGE